MKKILGATALVLLSLFVVGVTHFLLLKPKIQDTEIPVMQTPEALIGGERVGVVVAHDDDYLAAAATLQHLVEQGMEVHYLCLTNHNHHGMAEVRRKETHEAMKLLKASSVQILDMDLADSSVSYLPIPKETFADHYDLELIRSVIEDFVREKKPTAIFTLDHEIGGYGHPDHVVVSQTVHDVLQANSDSLASTLNQIWEIVYADPLEAYVNGEAAVYLKAMEVYEQPGGMPTPNRAFPVGKFGENRLSLIRTHASQHNSLKKFFPGYHLYPSWLYNWLYDTEYFRVIGLSDA